MTRNINITPKQRKVKVTCTDTDKTVEADLVLSEKSKIVVEMPTGHRITMTPHPTKPTIYVGSFGKLELICTPGA